MDRKAYRVHTKKVSTTVLVETAAYCSECNRELKSTVPGLYERAVFLDLRGGYGMALDEPTTRFVFCESCTTKMLHLLPSLKSAWISDPSDAEDPDEDDSNNP